MPGRLFRVAAIDDLHRRLIDLAGPFPAPGRVTEGGATDRPAGRPGLRRRPDGDKDEENFNPDGSRKDRHERKPDYDVGLICRTFAGDVGARPLSNMVFWESPDIWIEGSSGDPDIATPGEVNRVKVHVWNLGLADAWGTHIDLYWCDPSVGINAAVAHPIGSATLPLFAGQNAVVSFDWVPAFVNNGHACLVAQVYDPVSDPVVAPFNPVYDRHVGQRNISVLDVPAGGSTSFDFFTQNLSLSPAATTLEVFKVEREALDTVAMAMGTRTWRTAGGGDAVRLRPPVTWRNGTLPPGSPFATGVFRETLQGVPRASEARRVMGALRALAAGPVERPGKDSDPDDCGTATKSGRASAKAKLATIRESGVDAKFANRLDEGASDPGVWRADGEGAGRLHLSPGEHYRLTLEAEVPETARQGTADIYRVIERTAGQITGGVTVVIRTR
jgi:hypothetical protein